jgi:hypothetical protein
MERVRQARFACLFWQNLERQLEHYRTFISLLEKEKNSWESRYRAVASTTPTAPAPSIAPTPASTATTNTNPDATPVRHLPAHTIAHTHTPHTHSTRVACHSQYVVDDDRRAKRRRCERAARGSTTRRAR